MRVLLSAVSDAERAYLYKAFTESLNSVEVADDLHDAQYLASHEPFDAVIVCVPGVSSPDDPRSIPEIFSQLPERPSVIMILGQATPTDCARLLRAGADACFVQPYSVTEIIERLRALRRHFLPSGGTDPDLRLDPLTRECVAGSQRVALTKREYLLLECLLRQIGAPVPRERLIRYAWPEKDGVEPSNLNLVVLRMRRKLESVAPHVRIDTVSRYGYQIDTL